MPDVVWSCEAKPKSSQQDGKWQRRLAPWKQKWISDTSRDWDRKVEGFRDNIAIDGSLKKCFRKEMRLVDGQWCSQTTTRKRSHDVRSTAQCWQN